MKRMFSFFLALALLAVLSGCGKQESTPSKPDEPTPPPEEGITLAELNVEFVAGDRDTDALMQLKKELPPLLIGALADEGVTVGRVNVTFGASDEATADALARGSVQVGFMPMETYLAHEDVLRLTSFALLPEPEWLNYGASWSTGQTERGEAICRKAENGHAMEALTWDDIKDASWFMPRDGFPREWIDAYLYTNFDGHTVDDLQHVTFPDGQKPSAADYDLFVTYSSTAAEGLAVELLHLADGQVYPEAAVVSASDAIVGSDEFAEALAAALENESIQALMPLYDVEMYASVFLYGDRLDDARMLYAYRQAVSESQ